MEEFMDDLECIDLSEEIDKANKTAAGFRTKDITLAKTFVKQKNMTIPRNAKLNQSMKLEAIPEEMEAANLINVDLQDYIQKNLDANNILTNNFTDKAMDGYLNDKASFKMSLKATLLKDPNKFISNLKINEELAKKQAEEEENTISNDFAGGLKVGTMIFEDSVKISKLLGEGAQAKVYLGTAEDEDNQLIMAIKHFEFDVPANGDTTEIDNIVNKCLTMKELSHDNIIQYFDCESVYKEEERKCLVNIAMEFQETNLADYIDYYCKTKKVDYLPIQLVSKITKKILEGLAYLHENQIIHRDLKPENILMSKDGENVKIADFGISTLVNEDEKKGLVKTKVFLKRSVAGTAIYMAPEVLLSKPYGCDCDIWSLGCITFEMIGRVKPYCTKETDKKIPANELQLLKYCHPLEFADENVKDIIYEKKNRILLDFLLKCWRGNNVYRPNAKELLHHPFIKRFEN